MREPIEVVCLNANAIDFSDSILTGLAMGAALALALGVVVLGIYVWQWSGGTHE